MAENKTTISYEDLINRMDEKTTATKTIKALGENIEVRPILPMKEFEETFKRIIALIYDEDGEYNPIARDFVIRLCTVFAYTSIPFPEDIENLLPRLFDLMYETDFYNLVVKAVDENQYSALLNAVSEEIRYKNASNIDRVNNQIAKMSVMIEGIGEQFKEMLSGISEEDINKFIDAVQNGKINEGELVKAYMESKQGGEVDG